MNNRTILYYTLCALILLSMIVALPTYYTHDQRDQWRQAEQLTRDAPRIVVPNFNQIPLTYYSHQEEHGYTYFKEIPSNFTRGYVIVGPAGGYDPPMYEWFSNLTVYRNVTGIVIYQYNMTKIPPRENLGIYYAVGSKDTKIDDCNITRQWYVTMAHDGEIVNQGKQTINSCKGEQFYDG